MTCQHEKCSCEVPAGNTGQFCSKQCETATPDPVATCPCGHASCQEAPDADPGYLATAPTI